MMIVSVVVCVFAMSAGTYASFFLDSAPAPTIVLILTAVFIVAFVRRMMITKRMSQIAARAAV